MRIGAVRWRRANFDWLGWRRHFVPRWRVESFGGEAWHFIDDCWTRRGAMRRAREWMRGHR